MSDQSRICFDAFPGAAVLISQGNVAAANPMALHFLPQLKEGAPLPVELPQGDCAQSGLFTAGLSSYNYQLLPAPQGQWLLFSPAPQAALTDAQLEGALRQLRTLLGQFLTTWEQDRPLDRAAARKTFHQTFRLLDNMDTLRLSAQGTLPFHPVSMDLAGLCRQVVDCAAPLLALSQVPLSLQTAPSSLLIPGDPQLLRRLLLELITNAVRTAGGSQKYVSLSLSRSGAQAILTLSRSGDAPTQRQLAAMLAQDSDQLLPQPDAGAGLGMAIARQIIALHKGSILLTNSPLLAISLPTAPISSNLTLQTPHLQTDAGLSPLLVGLADVLSTDVFQVEDPD